LNMANDQAGLGETEVKAPTTKYWNSKKTPAAKGDQVMGVLVRAEADEYKGKPTTRYVIRGYDGNEITLPNHTLLNGALSRVSIGKTVRIVYAGKGEAARGRSAPELYKVYMSDTPTDQQPKAPPTAPTLIDDAVIAVMKGFVSIHDSRIDDLIAEVATQHHIACDIQEVKRRLKYGGKVIVEKDSWKVVA